MRYNLKARRKIKGWFSEIDNKIFETLLIQQNGSGIVGSTAEIGLHHGKSFIPLCLHLKATELAYGIDLFDQQSQNLDHSGNGSKNRVINNLMGFNVKENQYILDGRSSEEVLPAEILTKAGRVRFFSIDGGHWKSIVIKDLELADSVLAPGGVIALDDYLRPDWPEVAMGFHDWLTKNNDRYAIFAIGFNKVYVCEKNFVGLYQKALSEITYLEFMKRKVYKLDGIEVPIYFTFFLPEWNMRARAYGYFQLFHPIFFVRFKTFRSLRRSH